MARPLKIDGSGLKRMSDEDMDYAAHRILLEFANSNSGVGTLNFTSGTNIGSFIDTSRPDAIGDHPVGTSVLTSTTNFYQDLGTVTENPTRPVEFVQTPDDRITEQTNADLNTQIVNRAMQRLVNGGIGVYRMQVTAPTSGGTWTAIGTVTDTSQSGSTTTTLWRRSTEGSPATTVRPLKVVSDGLREMTDAEIQSLTDRLRARIVSTGIGQYKVQETAPTTGTWVRQGNIFYDSRQETGNVNYSGTYTGNFSGTYTGNYTGYYAGSRDKSYTGNYTGTYSSNFAGSYTGNYTLYYGGRNYGTYTGTYTGYYTGYFSGTYTGTYTGNYAGDYAGTYAGDYTGTYSSDFTGTYAGRTVLSTKENPSNVSLWLRVA